MILIAALAAAAMIVGAFLALAARRWRAATALAEARLHVGAKASAVSAWTDQAEHLPTAVRRYFENALAPGQRPIARARVLQRGTFLVRAPDTWRRFHAVEHFATQPPGFLWDARIAAFPGMGILVRDSLIGGAGSMHASLLGVLSLAASAAPDLLAGSMQRYVAEAVLLPTALLPAEGIAWTPIDDDSARATMSVGTTTIALDFVFGPDGLVESVFSAARGREVQGRFLPTPWRGRFWNYERHDGMAIPRAAEVEWVLPGGAQPYWRGRMTGLAYDYR